jgi:predicted DNA binding protein
MLLNTYIVMSTNYIVKLAEKFASKYCMNKLASNESETKRITQALVNRFSNYIGYLRDYKIAVTLKLEYESGMFAGGKIVAKEITWSANAPENVKASFKAVIDRMVDYLNTEGLKFEDGPWHVTLPPLK